jgi:hypothetical protein
MWVFKEFNAVVGQFELGWLRILWWEHFMSLSRSSFAAGANFVMSRSDIIGDEGRQWAVASLCSFVLVGRVLVHGGRFGDLGTGNAQNCWIKLIVGLLVLSVVPVVVFVQDWAGLFILKAHCVIRCLVFIVHTNVEVGLQGGPWWWFSDTCCLGEFTNLSGGFVIESSRVFTQNEVGCFQMVHHWVSVVLVESTFVGLSSKLSVSNVFLETWLVDKVGLWVLDCITLAALFANVVAGLLDVFREICRGVCLWWLSQDKVCLWKPMLLSLDSFLISTLSVREAWMNWVLVGLVGQLLLIAWLLGACHHRARSNSWLKFENLLGALGLRGFILWGLVKGVLHRLILHGGLPSCPACLAQTFLLILDRHAFSLGVLGLDRLDWFWVNHISVFGANIKVRGFHDALWLSDFGSLFSFVVLILDVEVGVVGWADGMSWKDKIIVTAKCIGKPISLRTFDANRDQVQYLRWAVNLKWASFEYP